MRARLIAAMMLACSSGAWAQTASEQLRYAEMALKDQAIILGGQMSCYRTLYDLPLAGFERRRFEDFKLSLEVLMGDYSNRVDAHITKFADAKVPTRQKSFLRLSTWRMVAGEIERQQTGSNDPSICDIIASGALASAEERGLRRSTTLTRRK